MDILNGLKKDIEDGIKQGVDAVKSTATLVKAKAEELTEMGKAQYRLYELRNKGQKQFAALGETFHRLAAAKKVSVSNQELKKLLAAADKTLAAIAKLEGKGSAPAPKKSEARKSVSKKRKTAGKQAAQKSMPAGASE